jgi:hypothetical protein
VAHWLETSKMRSSLAGNLLGGALLGDILQRLQAAQQAVSGGGEVRGSLGAGMLGLISTAHKS